MQLFLSYTAQYPVRRSKKRKVQGGGAAAAAGGGPDLPPPPPPPPYSLQVAKERVIPEEESSQIKLVDGTVQEAVAATKVSVHGDLIVDVLTRLLPLDSDEYVELQRLLAERTTTSSPTGKKLVSVEDGIKVMEEQGRSRDLLAAHFAAKEKEMGARGEEYIKLVPSQRDFCYVIPEDGPGYYQTPRQVLDMVKAWLKKKKQKEKGGGGAGGDGDIFFDSVQNMLNFPLIFDYPWAGGQYWKAQLKRCKTDEQKAELKERSHKDPVLWCLSCRSFATFQDLRHFGAKGMRIVLISDSHPAAMEAM